jgi:hypothetical protein
MYVYRWCDNRKTTPAILIRAPFPDLFECLRDKCQGGDIALMIRRGKIIEPPGVVSMAPKPDRG